MGCCFSSDRGNSSSVYPTNNGEASSQHINAASPRTSSVHHHTTRTSRGRQRNSYIESSHSQLQPSGAPNSPLKTISASRRSHTPNKVPWTSSRWRKEIEDYFDTRTSGRPETWLVVRSVAAMLREAQISEAQAMLDAAGCTCPNGRIWSGVWDELGLHYSVPEWIVVQPEELVNEDEEEDSKDPESAAVEAGRDAAALETSDRREEKGKGKVVDLQEDNPDLGEKIKIRARLSDRGTDVIVTIRKEEKVSILIRRIKEAAQLPPQTKVKIGYLGRVLQTSESLSAQGWNETHIINALVFNLD